MELPLLDLSKVASTQLNASLSSLEADLSIGSPQPQSDSLQTNPSMMLSELGKPSTLSSAVPSAALPDPEAELQQPEHRESEHRETEHLNQALIASADTAKEDGATVPLEQPMDLMNLVQAASAPSELQPPMHSESPLGKGKDEGSDEGNDEGNHEPNTSDVLILDRNCYRSELPLLKRVPKLRSAQWKFRLESREGFLLRRTRNNRLVTSL